MKLKPLALALILLASPASAFAASKVDGFATFQKLLAPGPTDGVWVEIETTALQDKVGDSSLVNVLAATSTRVGGSETSVASFSNSTVTDGEDVPDISFQILAEGRTVKSKEYLKLTGGWVTIDGKTTGFSALSGASSFLNLWSAASAEDLAGAEGSATALGAISELGKKDATYTVASTGTGTTVTAKVSKSSKFAKSHPLLAGATYTVTADATGAILRIDVAGSAKVSSVSASVTGSLVRTGAAPVGATVSAPTGSLAKIDDVSVALSAAVTEALLANIPAYQAPADGFSVKFAGAPDYTEDEDKSGNVIRLYHVQGDTFEEWVQASTPMVDGEEGEFTVGDDEFDSRVTYLKAWYKKAYGKKNVAAQTEVSVEGYRALRTVVYNKATKDYITYVDVTTEGREFEIGASDSTRAASEARLDRVIGSFDL